MRTRGLRLPSRAWRSWKAAWQRGRGPRMVPHALAWQLLMSFGSRRKQGISEVAGAGARSGWCARGGWQVRAGRVAGVCAGQVAGARARSCF